MPIQFGPLDENENRAAFSCGEPALDDWFHNRATQDQRRGIARVFVARDENLGIVGFYSLSAFSIEANDLPEHIARKLPRYNAIPAALIGRLARDLRMRGKNFGEQLAVDAIERLIDTSHQLGIYAIIVDAKHDRASAFYQSLGFQPFPSRRLRLFLTIATALQARVEASSET
ncbi:MAG: GNAT family N-acetyltransferase [Steroidobacteraceae bacterium]